MYRFRDSYTFKEVDCTMEDKGAGESTEDPERRARCLATLRKRKQKKRDKRLEFQEQRCEAC